MFFALSITKEKLTMPRLINRTLALTSVLGAMLMIISSTAAAQYQLTNLNSNQVKAATHTDPLLVNAWGMVTRTRLCRGGSVTMIPDGRLFTTPPEIPCSN